MAVGSGQTRLIILRGNSGAGKSTVALALRDAYGRAWPGCRRTSSGDRYEPMLAGLDRAHLGGSRFYYLDVSLDETLRRHATRPQAAEFGPDLMREWHRPRDLLAGIGERVILESSTLQETTSRILSETRLLPPST